RKGMGLKINEVCKVIILSSLISSCHNVPAWKVGIFERPPGDKEYPEMYLKGWQDGCESGADASANYLFKWKYKFRQDWQLLDNKLYVNGWEDAYNHCRLYVLQHNLKTLN
ncbi:MAG: hypothetical protein MK137_01290, partial [Rickettsiales bacterium]|nr:hypothetical protein [Rickettsiales bacterium]